MAFKFALIAAAAASRIARQADSENEKLLIKECQDTRPWINCIQAYSNGECHGLGGGCDRTCGLCKTDACYDRIPMPHVKMYEDGVPARAVWPTLSNRNGENSFPRRNTTEMAEFPWENGSFSSFCLNVFKNGLCGSYDSLSITYDDKTTVFLSGQPSEYCAFTCGVCKETSAEPSIAKCFADHNGIMFNLASKNIAAPILTFTDEELETTTNMYPGTESTEGTEPPPTFSEMTTVPWWEQFSFRKRRSQLAIEKRDIIVSAIESILSQENRRERRSLFDFAFTDFGDFFGTDPGQITNVADNLVSCNDMLVKNLDFGNEEEGDEDEEEEELYVSPLEDVVNRRKQKDHDGIRQYFGKNSEKLTVDVAECKWVKIKVDEEIEDLGGIELSYDCPISCPSGYALEIEGEDNNKEEEIRVNCNKEGKQSTNMLKDSICEAAKYCPNHFCQKIKCVPVEEEESESESLSEFGW